MILQVGERGRSDLQVLEYMSHRLKAKVEKIIQLLRQIGQKGIIGSQAVCYEHSHTGIFPVPPNHLFPLSFSLFFHLRHTHTLYGRQMCDVTSVCCPC